MKCGAKHVVYAQTHSLNCVSSYQHGDQCRATLNLKIHSVQCIGFCWFSWWWKGRWWFKWCMWRCRRCGNQRKAWRYTRSTNNTSHASPARGLDPHSARHWARGRFRRRVAATSWGRLDECSGKPSANSRQLRLTLAKERRGYPATFSKRNTILKKNTHNFAEYCC